MLSESFARGTSVLHRLDPRLRIVFATLMSILLAVSTAFPTLFTGLALSAGLVLVSGLPLVEVARRLTVVNLFNIVLFLVLPVTFEGTPAFLIGPLTCTREGLLLAARITIKSNAILMVFVALVATMPIATLGHGLHRLHMPKKLVYLLLIAYRYVFVLEQEYQRLHTAIRIRGFIPKTNLHTYKTYAYLFGMLLVRALARADRVYQAMLCRGFKGKFYCIHQFSFSWTDRLWTVFFVVALIVLGGLEWVPPAIF
ncbi:cobalt ECF transporter T component CbiQ [uncultured Desulfosarcina sp.]|uniref:cobalt ECF transporter T component CbiQ n=1 Tax=uncultured Desulfosarcina sp. TaxID=218289 RepID=UPI0029C7CF4B|nr:cobalt ECF transporter T component CbiQ [uncultured Desulfosarcina sp.]